VVTLGGRAARDIRSGGKSQSADILSEPHPNGRSGAPVGQHSLASL
jgi:hypothetical protein